MWTTRWDIAVPTHKTGKHAPKRSRQLSGPFGTSSLQSNRLERVQMSPKEPETESFVVREAGPSRLV